MTTKTWEQIEREGGIVFQGHPPRYNNITELPAWGANGLTLFEATALTLFVAARINSQFSGIAATQDLVDALADAGGFVSAIKTKRAKDGTRQKETP